MAVRIREFILYQILILDRDGINDPAHESDWEFSTKRASPKTCDFKQKIANEPSGEASWPRVQIFQISSSEACDTSVRISPKNILFYYLAEMGLISGMAQLYTFLKTCEPLARLVWCNLL